MKLPTGTSQRPKLAELAAQHKVGYVPWAGLHAERRRRGVHPPRLSETPEEIGEGTTLLSEAILAARA